MNTKWKAAILSGIAIFFTSSYICKADPTRDQLLATLTAAVNAKSQLPLKTLVSYQHIIKGLPVDGVSDIDNRQTFEAYLLLLRLIDNSIDHDFNRKKIPTESELGISQEEQLRVLGGAHEGPITRADVAGTKDPEIQRKYEPYLAAWEKSEAQFSLKKVFNGTLLSSKTFVANWLSVDRGKVDMKDVSKVVDDIVPSGVLRDEITKFLTGNSWSFPGISDE